MSSSKSRGHLAWTGVSIAALGLGFGLTASQGEPAPRPTRVANAEARARSAPPSPLGEASPTVATHHESAVNATSPTRRPYPTLTTRQAEPARTATSLVRGSRWSQSLQRLAESQGSGVEDLLSALFRIPLGPSNERTWAISKTLERGVLDGLTDASKRHLILASSLRLPGHELWKDWPDPEFPLEESVAIRRTGYEQAPTKKSLQRLLDVLQEQDTKDQDPELIESLLRSHPDDETLQRMLAARAPERISEVFARDGLTRSERRLLIEQIGEEDPREAAALALALFEESRASEDFKSALRKDARAANAFFRERRLDPAWRDLELAIRLELNPVKTLPKSDPEEAPLSPREAIEEAVYDLESATEGGWTAQHADLLARVVPLGDWDLIDSALSGVPARERWQRLAEANYRPDPRASRYEAEIYWYLLQQEPFAARDLWQTFLAVCPILDPLDSKNIAESFQSKGDPGKAREALFAAPPTRFITQAKRYLARGVSLEYLDESQGD
ncbi:MAG: hypothetical protein JKY65_03450 [Planctomycetes bacterium]|nr:hypothetical protein [Planctomycetota bacterium]